MNVNQISDDLIRTLEDVEIGVLNDLYNAASQEIAERIGIQSNLSNSTLITVVSSSYVLALNRVLGLGIAKTVTSDDIEKIISIYKSAGVKRFFIQLNPLITDSSIPELLEYAGFIHYNNWIKLYRDVTPLNKVKSNLTVKKIDQNLSNNFAKIVCDNFEWGNDCIPWIAATVGRNNWYHYMAFDNDKPAATGAFYKHNEYAWIDFAATKEEYRGKGAQAIISKMRIDDIIESGVKNIVVETAQQTEKHSTPSYRNMLRYGFKEAYVRPNYLMVFE